MAWLYVLLIALVLFCVLIALAHLEERGRRRPALWRTPLAPRAMTVRAPIQIEIWDRAGRHMLSPVTAAQPSSAPDPDPHDGSPYQDILAMISSDISSAVSNLDAAASTLTALPGQISSAVSSAISSAESAAAADHADDVAAVNTAISGVASAVAGVASAISNIAPAPVTSSLSSVETGVSSSLSDAASGVSSALSQ